MQDRQDQPDLRAVRLATVGTAIAFVVAAIAGWFVNRGIAIAFFIGAVICCIVASNSLALTDLRFRLPFTREARRQRTHWDVFRLTVYASVTVALLASVILGSAFYIFELQGSLEIAQHGRHLSGTQRGEIVSALSASKAGQLIYVMSLNDCDECECFAQEIRDAIDLAPNWNAGGQQDPFRRSGSGLKVMSIEPQHPPKLTATVANALAAAGIFDGWQKISDGAYETGIYVYRAR